MRPYIGKTLDGSLVTFRSAVIPTAETHGATHKWAIGPFRTKRAALFMLESMKRGGSLNCATVADAESAAKQA